MRTINPIRPSAAIRAAYERRVFAAVDEMHSSLLHWIGIAYRANTPETVLMGEDELPARALQRVVSKVGARWLKRFDELADNLAAYFAKAVKDRCDRALADDLRRGGMTVRFKMTRAMRDAYEAVRAENVGLIRSIAQEHLTHVETLVMQSVSQGRDLATLTKALTKNHGVTRRRAARIALHQNNMATAVLRVARERELGITEGEWLHSAGGKTPRPEHVAFSGKRFKLADGHDFKDGLGPVLPGGPINCRCTWKAVVPGFDA